MRKVKLNNDDLIQYLNTIKALKQYPTMSEYRDEYRRLRTNGSPLIEAKQFKSAHTDLFRLDRKKKSLLGKFIEELNPISHASAIASKSLEKVQESMLYRKTLIKKHLMNSSLLSSNNVQKLLLRSNVLLNRVLSNSLTFRQSSNHQVNYDEKWPYKSVLRFSFEMVLIDCSNANIYYIINMLVCFKSIIRQYWTPFDPTFQTQDGIV